MGWVGWLVVEGGGDGGDGGSGGCGCGGAGGDCGGGGDGGVGGGWRLVAVVVARAPAGLEGGAASPGVGSACAMSGARLRGIATLPSPAA